LNKDIAEHALEYARTKDVEYAEVRAHTERQEQVVLNNGVIEAYLQSVDSGFCVRILADGGLGFASSNRWNRDETRNVVDSAYKFARGSARREPIVFAPEKGVETVWSVEQKKKIEDVDPETKIGFLSDIDKTLASLGVKVPARIIVCIISLTDKYFVNTEGSRIASFVPKIACATSITVIEQGKPEQASTQFGYSGGWEAFDIWNVTDEMSREANVLKSLIEEGKPITPGKTDIVCGHEVVGIAAHESCGHPMEADRILGREMSQAGCSFVYQGGPYWIGTRIGSLNVTIVDDPRIRNSYGYYEYDDEGVKARSRYLYKEGIINEFLHNRETAAKLATRSNGSSRSVSYDREAIVRMANTYVQPGDQSEEEILEDVKHGVYMKSFTEWNIDDRRFNQRYVGREAYFIENGELRGPVVRPVIETSTLNFWSSVDAVSKKVYYDATTCGKGDPGQGIAVYAGGPMIRLKEVYLR
jgi:TldD protein